MIITGIGSRKTPQQTLSEMTEIGKWCLDNGVVIRSGHADGADWAFEQGAQSACICYLPWLNFNSNLTSAAKMVLYKRNKETIELARTHHPSYDRLGYGVKVLMERDGWQVLGEDLKTPSAAVVCWTADGKSSGGTGQAMRIAKANNIALYNMFYPDYNTAEKVIAVLTHIKEEQTK